MQFKSIMSVLTVALSGLHIKEGRPEKKGQEIEGQERVRRARCPLAPLSSGAKLGCSG